MVRNGISYVPGYASKCSSIQGKAGPSLEEVEEELRCGGILTMGERVISGRFVLKGLPR